MGRRAFDLSTLNWRVAGYTPYYWRLDGSVETSAESRAEVPPVTAQVPGSVQQALHEAGMLPDWNIGLQARECEWVENRHWVYEADLPDDWFDSEADCWRLHCLGLDYSGWVFLNGIELGHFAGSFQPHVFDLKHARKPKGNTLRIIFDCPPRWLGQFGYTSEMKEWKPRFNYTWDWTSRLVQLGIWDDIYLECYEGSWIDQLRCTANLDLEQGTGSIRCFGRISGDGAGRLRLALSQDGRPVAEKEVQVLELQRGICWDQLEVEPWWPNLMGEQPLYDLAVELMDENGRQSDYRHFRLGFKHIKWRPCAGAPEGADPWVCVINGRPVFLQGVNWTPIRPNFADLTRDDYRRYIETYRELGCNLLRVWGGAFLEKKWFYDLCDEAGLLVWQEFPLSSSGVDNWPPEDEKSIAEIERIARSYIHRRGHHVSLLLWCGGNELQTSLDGGKQGTGKPLDTTHPMLRRLAEVVKELDPDRRFLPTSSSGPRFYANKDDFSKGLHWDVHGPWQAPGDSDAACEEYWEEDDALFRSETGAPGASPAAIIRKYAGDLPVTPGTIDNPLWRRTSWWIDWPLFVKVHEHQPETLEEYVAWSQERQAWLLEIAAKSCKRRFPRCGGFLVWMGHDSFPCTANTAIIDFHGEPKPAARRLQEIFLKDPTEL